MNGDDQRFWMLLGRVELLERALLRTMTLLISREPDPLPVLKDLEQDFRSFVLSLPMAPEELQGHARRVSDELLRKIADSLQAYPDSPNDGNTRAPDLL